MTKGPKSNCCNAEMKVVCGDDFGTPNDQVTYHYECTKCEKACDPAPKASNSSEKSNSSMLDNIFKLANQITKYTILAMLTKDDKEQDEFVEKIIKYNEEIEEQYSTNWH